jgi:hypothetical protein
MELYCTPKINTLQLNTETLQTHVHVRPVRSRNAHSYRILPTGPLVAIFPTLTPILAVIKLPNTRRDNPSSGYRFTCTPRHLGVYIINPLFTSPDDRMSSPSTVALRITSNLYSFSDPTVVSVEIHRHPTRNHRHARPLLRAQQCCLFTLLSAKYCCITKETPQRCIMPLL